MVVDIEVKQLPSNGNERTEEAMRKGRLRCQGRHLAVEVKVKARLSKNEFIVLPWKRNKRFSIVLVHLNVHIVAPINDSPLVSVPYPSNNTL